MMNKGAYFIVIAILVNCRVIQDFDFCKLDDLMTQNDLTL